MTASYVINLIPAEKEISRETCSRNRRLYNAGWLTFNAESIVATSCILSILTSAATLYAVPEYWDILVLSGAFSLMTLAVLFHPNSPGFTIIYYLNVIFGILIVACDVLMFIAFTFISDATFMEAIREMPEEGITEEELKRELPSIRFFLLTVACLETFFTYATVSGLRHIRREAKLSLPQ